MYPVKAGYDVLVPENPRRDAGLSGVLFVRRQTREVESLFAGNDEDNGISIIGDYLPTQEMLAVSSPSQLTGAVDVLLSQQGFVTTAGTNRPYGTGNNYANAIVSLLGPGTDLDFKVDPQSLVSTQTFEGAYNRYKVDAVVPSEGSAYIRTCARPSACTISLIRDRPRLNLAIAPSLLIMPLIGAAQVPFS